MGIIIRNQKLFCLNCGGSFSLAFPIPINEMAKKIKAFNALHKDCPVTWKEPEADQSQSVEERAYWWLANGEQGLSSIIMCRALMGDPVTGANHPLDPDDFRRCYLLLRAVPEWREELKKRDNAVARISTPWHNLCLKWEELTEMLEEQFKTHKPNGMYELMQDCINNKI